MLHVGSNGGRPSHAAVIGGGIAGLLAAGALASRFERVTVVERDRYPARPGPRRGTPQSRCLHMLMASGLRAFEEILPGFGAGLEAAGAVAFDVGEEAELRFPYGWSPRFRSGITMYACSRGLLEQVLRCRVLRDRRVRVLQGRAALGLVTGAGGRVTSVRTEGPSGAEEPVEADLVVLAGGRGAALPGWLAALGLPAPEETAIDARFHYTCRWYVIPERSRGAFKLLATAPGEGRRAGAVFEAERSRWAVLLLGPRDEPAPATGPEMLAFARGLPDRRLHDAIAGARPASPVLRYGATGTRVHHCERVEGWPDGLVAIGDAVCALDPYFGLGMTAAAHGAVLLRAHVEAGLGAPGDAGAARRFQARLAEVHQAPLRLVARARGPGEPASAEDHLLQCLYRLAPASPAITRVLLERMHLLAPPDRLSSPDLADLVRAELGRLPRPSIGSPIGEAS